MPSSALLLTWRSGHISGMPDLPAAPQDDDLPVAAGQTKRLSGIDPASQFVGHDVHGIVDIEDRAAESHDSALLAHRDVQEAASHADPRTT